MMNKIKDNFIAEKSFKINNEIDEISIYDEISIKLQRKNFKKIFLLNLEFDIIK